MLATTSTTMSVSGENQSPGMSAIGIMQRPEGALVEQEKFMRPSEQLTWTHTSVPTTAVKESSVTCNANVVCGPSEKTSSLESVIVMLKD